MSDGEPNGLPPDVVEYVVLATPEQIAEHRAQAVERIKAIPDKQLAEDLQMMAARTLVHECCETCESVAFGLDAASLANPPNPEDGWRCAANRPAYYKPCKPDDPEGYAWIARVPVDKYRAFLIENPYAFALEDLRALLPEAP